jgi:hypothetical protein
MSARESNTPTPLAVRAVFERFGIADIDELDFVLSTTANLKDRIEVARLYRNEVQHG